MDLFFGFYLIYWYFWGMAISLQVALGCLISGTNSTDVAEGNLPWSFDMYFSAPLIYLLIYMNLVHTPPCNGLVLLPEFETCLSYDESLTKVI